MTGPVYAHRPSKDVTRRIFVDMLHQLDFDGAMKHYQYVGFGALEFIDFDAIHRSLGITQMFSIENDPNIERYEANKPYQCISVLPGHSTDMLTKVNWSALSVVWLDYECQLNSQVLTDVEYLCQKLVPGSVLAVTLNASPGALADRRERLVANIGEERVPPKTDDDTLGDWGWAKAQQRVLFTTLRRKLAKRPDSAFWWQGLNVNYRDGAPMQLVAGVIGTPALEARLDQSGVAKASYFRPEGVALSVEVPYLTAHEQRLVRRKLPLRKRQRVPTLPGVPAADVSNYVGHYQWIGA